MLRERARALDAENSPIRGQGREAAYAQFLSDQAGIPAHLINVVQGGTDRLTQGTGRSRSVAA